MTSGKSCQAGRSPRAVRCALSVIFAVQAAIYTSWLPHLPQIQSSLGLSSGQLGTAFVGMVIGPVAAMPCVGWLCARYGSRRTALAVMIGYCAVLPLPAVAFSLPTLFIAILLLGAGHGSSIVAINDQGLGVQQLLGRQILSSLHAANNFGGMIGIAIALLAVQLRPLVHLTVAAVFFATLVLYAFYLIPGDPNRGHDSPSIRQALPSRALLPLCLLAVLSFTVDGAVTNWSTVYLTRALHLTASAAAAGLLTYSAAMTASRTIGGRLLPRWGPPSVIRRGCLLAGLAGGGCLILQRPVPTFIGFALLGIGIGCLLPAVLSAVGRDPDRPRALSVAAVSTTGYAGFVLAPALFGLVAAWLSLPLAFLFIAPVALAPAALASVVTATPRQTADDGQRAPDRSRLAERRRYSP